MIVRQDKIYEQNSMYPDSNFTDHLNVFIIDETTGAGRALAEKIINNSPYFNFILDPGGNLIDITPTERPLQIQLPLPVTLEQRVSLQQEAIDFVLMSI